MADRPLYAADTHSLLWYLHAPKRLGPAATSAFAEIESGQADLIVSVIVIAEIIYILQAGKVNADFDEVLARLQASPNVVIAPLTTERVAELNTATAVPEMHDRMIAVEAKASGATLITYDQAITASGFVPTVW
ncbi:MAG: type II toxin-antitoxin system VapC family toxin [Chloroflexi bacterium]|nr:type II toxin-antitoxin system VapC family toxin [Chloroflexota bacterium]MBI4315129.1 type II toxin-antitoxin system VapC family toxin [Chloroflexota bacterium]MBI5291613.1 type II toxin-antitoxin system VapC family toxin [Chloroflexota bacterium]MBI5829981.1 type II toxin-antitoxin system VapC family toxin [Chloroflexota bacterium]